MTFNTMTVAERIEFYTDKLKGRDACHEWRGATTHGKGFGYAVLNIDGRPKLVTHIIMGEKPAGMRVVCHKCDNSLCVRKSHLFWGTHKDNSQDALRKGRMNTLPARQAKVKLGLARRA